MMIRRAIPMLTCALLAASASAGLTTAEKAAGWRMLFDGETWDGWRSYKKMTPPTQGWVIEDGALHHQSQGGGGDIVTDEEFGDFELSLEFKVGHHANSGIIYRVREEQDYPWRTGPEYQILDDDRPEADNKLHSVAALYDIYEPAADKPVKPAGEWNHARIRIHEGIVQHYLNGMKVVEYDWNGQDWKDGIAGSKFNGWEGFGVQPRGHIALQDHGDDVWYRNIKIRELDKPMPGEMTLFDGSSTEGWVSFLQGGGTFGGTWSVEDGVLVCTGEPLGYIKTEAAYDDFVLKFSWRWDPETKEEGNSGVLLRTVGEDKIWPDCLEAQLKSGHAGDFWNMSGELIGMPRPNGRNGKKSHHAERPVGEWNDYEIVCHGDRVTLSVNGQLVNEATGVPARAGTIGFQSEGAPIHFRDIRLAPID